ncbi:MAG: sodium-dependent transporter [Bacteroidales bacterium]|nr:sodium-dependent transporter [Bacteroidales bacterium]
MKDINDNNTFSSNFGAIMAAVGSAVGLDNIWRFPYICGKYGGGAFLLVCLVFIFLLGQTMMMSEFVVGRRTGFSPMKAYPLLVPSKPRWRLVGHFGVLATFITLSVYFVISGWTTGYLFDSCTGTISHLGQDAATVTNYFNVFSSHTWRPIVFLVFFGIASAAVVISGVRKGIEGVSRVLMPVLVVLLMVLSVYALTLPGSLKGVEYLLVPDFSKLNGEAILAALGQALFSLSVGIGMMTVYGIYLPKKDNIMKTTLWITLSDSFIAILAGVAIFPAVFSCGMEPAEGAGLVFKVLPMVFNDMGGIGRIMAVMFFLLLVLAALTSAISMLAYLKVWLSELLHCGRILSTVICTVAALGMAILLSLSNGLLSDFTLFDRNLFTLFDLISGTYLFPICALFIAIYFGWIMPKEDIRDELSNHGTLSIRYFGAFLFIVRYIVPVALLVVIVSGIINNL